jgi:hypothetical protein
MNNLGLKPEYLTQGYKMLSKKQVNSRIKLSPEKKFLTQLESGGILA